MISQGFILINYTQLADGLHTINVIEPSIIFEVKDGAYISSR